jgi:cellobiose-specific phosphotransferase system component IIC
MTASSSSTASHTRRRGIRALAPWLSRLVLIPPTLIMILIGVRYIRNPSHAASPTGVALSTPEALTDTRVVGALALTVAFAVAASLVSRRSFKAGHAIVIALMAFIVAVRLFGFAKDGTTLAMGDQRVKMTGEILFLVLNTVAFSIQTYLAKPAGAEG